MSRHARFEAFQYVGDRDSQRVYDQDAGGEACEAAVAGLVAANRATVFSPDTLAEARNRGYRSATP